MESSLMGISVMMLGSLAIASYLIINGDMAKGFKWLLGVSELGVLSFQYSLLVTTYQAYNQYKLANDMYPKEYKLKMKIDNARQVRDELNQMLDDIDKENVEAI
jgi:hypothetical protein